jgi:hypothetical protein
MKWTKFFDGAPRLALDKGVQRSKIYYSYQYLTK